MKECILVCFCLWDFFGSIYTTSSLNPTLILPLMFIMIILAKCCGITSRFFGRLPILYFTCLPIRKVAFELLCPSISVSCDYFYVVLFEMLHICNY